MTATTIERAKSARYWRRGDGVQANGNVLSDKVPTADYPAWNATGGSWFPLDQVFADCLDGDGGETPNPPGAALFDLPQVDGQDFAP